MPALRAFAKTAAAELLARSGAFRTRRAAAPAALVLGYHRVVEDTAGDGSIPAMLVTASMLERQLAWLDRHFRIVSLDELADRLESGAAQPRPLAAVTFDDGYADVYEHGFPLLQRMGIPSAVFVVTDLVGTSRMQTHDRLYLAIARLLARPDGGEQLLWRLAGLGLQPPTVEAMGRAAAADVVVLLQTLRVTLPTTALDVLARTLSRDAELDEDAYRELRPLDVEQLRTMARAGVVIGSHTRSHALLTQETPERVAEELRVSRDLLQEALGQPVRYLAYPDGRFNTRVVDEVEAAGYRTAFTTCQHRDPRRPRLTVPRRLLWENSCRDGSGRFSAAVMSCQVGGMFDWMGRCRQDHGPYPAERRRPA
jgi:peptidoglycan/xylan/chitin deacetylase (PgdA/CDA1 family)